MVDILHRVGMKDASPDEVYAALTTIDGLSRWWTVETTGTPEVGGTVSFGFGTDGFDMLVREQVPGTRVLWEVVEGPPEWIGTTVRWDLAQADGYTIVLFGHEGWREPVDFMAHCSTKWATFLMSLKQLVETGAGSPAPDDVRISDWH
ncbi:SRPBCC family protein [Cellulomonas fengjieae]|uniref:SRPBCC family protein n=1 Tax=Cellulomonas fengjieae TaxID=2819978 RepID=UPI001AAF557A|nr:SRPBCC domain-containing protein [Cellulomonas fengjieae]MBO3103959.1 SRPBCC domain-containing protein [Cellulomonas fengjieae]